MKSREKKTSRIIKATSNSNGPHFYDRISMFSILKPTLSLLSSSRTPTRFGSGFGNRRTDYDFPHSRTLWLRRRSVLPQYGRLLAFVPPRSVKSYSYTEALEYQCYGKKVDGIIFSRGGRQSTKQCNSGGFYCLSVWTSICVRTDFI